MVHDGEAEVVVYGGAVDYDLELGEDEYDEPGGGVGGAVAGEREVEGPIVGLAYAWGLDLPGAGVGEEEEIYVLCKDAGESIVDYDQPVVFAECAERYLLDPLSNFFNDDEVISSCEENKKKGNQNDVDESWSWKTK